MRIASTTDKTYTDKPLYGNQNYNYTIIAINEYGNAFQGVNFNAKTENVGVSFRGLPIEVLMEI